MTKHSLQQGMDGDLQEQGARGMAEKLKSTSHSPQPTQPMKCRVTEGREGKGREEKVFTVDYYATNDAEARDVAKAKHPNEHILSGNSIINNQLKDVLLFVRTWPGIWLLGRAHKAGCATGIVHPTALASLVARSRS